MGILNTVSREYSYFKFFLQLVGRSRKFDKKKINNCGRYYGGAGR